MTQRAVLIVIFWSALLCAGSSAQNASLYLSDPVQISPVDKNYYNAGWARAMQSSAQHMMVCGEVTVPRDNGLFSYVYTTADGGHTWRLGTMDRSSKWVSEESCAYGNRGIAYFTTGESNFYNGESHHEEGTFHLFRSSDYGATWARVSSRPFVDYTADTVDQTGGRGAGTLYVFANAAVLRPGQWWGQTGELRADKLGSGLYHAFLLTSNNGGTSLSRPVRAHPLGFELGEAFAGGSTVLENGTPVVVDETIHEWLVKSPHGSHTSVIESHNAIDVLVSPDRGRSLVLRATVRDAGAVRVWPSTIAQDKSNGPLRGRLYVSWIEASPTHSTIVLGTSDDNGFHWKMHAVIDGSSHEASSGCNHDSGPPRSAPPALDVNRRGIVGVAWAPHDGASIRFAISSDGGKTFQPSIEVVGCFATTDARYLENGMFAWPFDSRLGAQAAAISSGSHAPLGLSINFQSSRVSPELLSDSAGAFHAFWTADGPGRGALWTRSISVESGSPGENLRYAPASRLRAEMSRNIAPATDAIEEARPKSVGVAGLHDITAAIAFDFSNLSYDANSHIFTVRVSIINKGNALIKGPLRIVAVGLRSDLGMAHALNAAGMSGRGQPIWDFSSVVPMSGLKHEAATTSMPLRFQVAPLNMHNAPGSSPVAMSVRVYANFERPLRHPPAARMCNTTRITLGDHVAPNTSQKPLP
jgi:hypothetical protein